MRELKLSQCKSYSVLLVLPDSKDSLPEFVPGCVNSRSAAGCSKWQRHLWQTQRSTSWQMRISVNLHLVYLPGSNTATLHLTSFVRPGVGLVSQMGVRTIRLSCSLPGHSISWDKVSVCSGGSPGACSFPVLATWIAEYIPSSNKKSLCQFGKHL